MFLGLFVVLLIMWLMGFFAFHVAGGLIHLLANNSGDFSGGALPQGHSAA